MKKLLLLSTLLIFVFGFGQDSKDFDYKDLKNINSAKLFKKFCFEKEFTKLESQQFLILRYAQGYDSDNEVANVWAYYYPNNTFSMTTFRNVNGSSVESFNNVLNQVKKICKFYDFKDDVNGWEYICYSCPNSSFKGKIGFLRGKDGSDTIQTFDF